MEVFFLNLHVYTNFSLIPPLNCGKQSIQVIVESNGVRRDQNLKILFYKVEIMKKFVNKNPLIFWLIFDKDSRASATYTIHIHDLNYFSGSTNVGS